MIRILGSMLCKDCVQCRQELDAAKVNYEYCDFSDELKYLKEFLVLTMLLLIMASVASSLTLPFVFKYGVEKGRGAYYVMIGVVCAGSIIATTIFKEGLQNEIQLNAVLPIACLVGIGIYVLSWYLSVVFYKKKEM